MIEVSPVVQFTSTRVGRVIISPYEFLMPYK